ncbi:Cys-tRNA(Pro) deacylase [Aromatoleum bremense]|uniref:Cys-tRNA(Pro)/Cys-tRNA(Cys) deacylase n=1 Tax=Aromatoleum bremense TaxID=76115 RepID=A0ABX1NUI9_9RHOO|nr:Cys-tRNA(Pro) deacylase [Aromatoleum bremense]NMG15578.1 Cys-tRNA(Pro) deacylase [Aromatoleum bremense]QTQ32900.1 Cys-tRNA(Pro)/Cys-tRNA(Cys) deacylase [Aromatoleum bremense]
MSRTEHHAPETPATRFLKQHRVTYTTHLYSYEPHGGTKVSARELDVDEHAIVKTLVMEDESGAPLIVLMHGDRKVSTKELARQAGRKRIEPCTPEVANRHSGYLVGGTSPFGMRKRLPVFLENSIVDLPLVYINGGRRGFLLGISPQEILRVLQPQLVSAGI